MPKKDRRRRSKKLKGKPVMTTAEVAQLLGCTQRMVQLLIKRGRMRALVVGSDYRVSQRDYRAFVKAYETKPAN